MSKQNITMTINESLEDSEKKPIVSVADRIKAIEKAKSEEEEEYVCLLYTSDAADELL